MNDRDETIAWLHLCDGHAIHTGHGCENCPFLNGTESGEECVERLHSAAVSLLKAQEPQSLLKTQDATMLQGFLTDIPSSESIMNSVICHAISLEDASHIIAICACACDVMSSSGFIHWLKERFNQDLVLKGCVPK